MELLNLRDSLFATVIAVLGQNRTQELSGYEPRVLSSYEGR